MSEERLCQCVPQRPRLVRQTAPFGILFCRDCGLEWGRPICSCGHPNPRYGKDIGVCPWEVHYGPDSPFWGHGPVFNGWGSVEMVVKWCRPNKWHPRYWWYRFRLRFWPYAPVDPSEVVPIKAKTKEKKP